MDRPLSTSSSREPALPVGFPWALILAIAAVACVEIVFRSAEPRALIPYDLGRLEYEATAQFLEIYGPAEVSIIGSSRAREGIVVPVLAGRLTSALRRPVTVANYACSSTHAGENLQLVEYLLANGRPKLVLYGASCRQLFGDTIRSQDVARFSIVSDWWKDLHENGPRAVTMLPRVIWRAIGARWHTLRYRKRVRTLASDTVRALRNSDTFNFSVEGILRGAPSPSPQRGELTRWHRNYPDRSLQNRPVSDERVTVYVSRLLRDGAYFFTEMQEDSLRKVLRTLRAASVEVVLFEIPLSGLLQKHFPLGTVSRARATFARIAACEDVRFISVEEYGLEWSDADFLEQSHLNIRGATRLTEWLAEHVVLPRLRGGDN